MNPIVVLGAGLSGLTVAAELAERGREVLVLERESAHGGLAASFIESGRRYDYGSHRIHPEALPRLARATGTAFVGRPRGGRLRLRGRWLAYPPTLLDMIGGLGPRAAFACATSLAAARLGRAPGASYESYLRARAGDAAYELFYAPYAEKVWGLPPSRISADEVRARVTMTRPTEVVWDAARRALSGGPPQGRYYHPAGGTGAVADSLRARAERAGARVVTGVALERVEDGRELVFRERGVRVRCSASALVSTIPLRSLVALLAPGHDPHGERLRTRGLRLLYVVIDRTGLIPNAETFYFPELRFWFGRVSIPERFNPTMGTRGAGVTLCLELPCTPGDERWTTPDDALLARLRPSLDAVGLTAGARVHEVFSRRVPEVYPVYELGWREHFDAVRERLALRGILTLGRQGSFAHDNMDHCVARGEALAKLLHEHPRDAARRWLELAAELGTSRVRD